jgi:hypothetical protein
MAISGRYRALEQAGLLHPAPDAVVSEPFRSHPQFFASFDKVQVKYEMLRAHAIDGKSATAAAESPGTRARRFIWFRRRSSARGWSGCWPQGRSDMRRRCFCPRPVLCCLRRLSGG